MIARLRVIVGVLLVSSTAFGFRGRPISDLRFESQISGSFTSVATDGTDFLAVFERWRGLIYGQMIVGGKPEGPAFLIAEGSSPSVVWTGSVYLGSWATDRGVYVGQISRRGGIHTIPAEPLLSGLYLRTRLTLGTKSTLLSAEPAGSAVQTPTVTLALDSSGRAIGSTTLVSDYSFQPYAVTATDYGFAVATAGFNGTSIVRVSHDGMLLGRTLIEGPYVGHADTYKSFAIAAASDGGDVYVSFAASAYQQSTAVKSAIVGSDGEIKHAPTTILQADGDHSHVPRSMQWRGTEAVMLLGIARDAITYTNFDPAILRIGRGGYLSAKPEVVPAPLGTPDAIAWNGREYLIVSGSHAALLPIGRRGAVDVIALGRALNQQSGVKIAASTTQYLAAWYETTEAGSQIRASRVDRDGNYLDHDLAIAAHVERPDSLDLASNGTDWIIVWNRGAVRISSEGKLLDVAPIGGGGMAVAWGGGSYLIVDAQSDLLEYPVTPGGSVGATTRIAAPQQTGVGGIYFAFPSVAWDGKQFLLTYGRVESSTFIGNPPIFVTESRLEGIRVTPSGSLFDLQPFVIAQGVTGALLASDGSRDFIAWQKDGAIRASIVPADDPMAASTTSFVIISQPSISLSSVAFDGHNFLVGWETTVGRSTITLTRVAAGGTLGLSVSLQRELLDTITGMSIAARSEMPLIVAFGDRQKSYDGINRVALALESDVVSPSTVPPGAPGFIAASVEGDVVDVVWTPLSSALGYEIDAKLLDGGYRQIAVAASNARSARVSLLGLDAIAVSLRAWNAAGVSATVSEASLTPLRRRAIRR